jgi:hypothetical protein
MISSLSRVSSTLWVRATVELEQVSTATKISRGMLLAVSCRNAEAEHESLEGEEPSAGCDSCL